MFVRRISREPLRQYRHQLLVGQFIYLLMLQQIEWVPLRLNILPVIHKQTLKVLDCFLMIRADILEGDILGLEKLREIKQKVEQRIKSVDTFYVSRPIDPRMKYLYGIRVVLAQIVQGCAEFQSNFEQYLDQREEESKPQFPQPTYSPEKILPQESSQAPTAKSKIPTSTHTNHTPSQEAVNINYSQQSRLGQGKKPGGRDAYGQSSKQKVPEPARLSDLKKTNKSNKSPSRLTIDDPRKGSARKVEGGPARNAGFRGQDLMQSEREWRESMARLEKQPEVKKSFRDLSELVFTIKMTKQQYNQFMRLKRKNNHA